MKSILLGFLVIAVITVGYVIITSLAELAFEKIHWLSAAFTILGLSWLVGELIFGSHIDL